MSTVLAMAVAIGCAPLAPSGAGPGETGDDTATLPPPVDDSTAPPTDDSGTVVPPAPDTIRITEIVSDAGDKAPDWIEIWNHGKVDVDLSGWTIQDRSDSAALSGVLAPDARLVLTADAKGDLGFALDKDGGSLTLRSTTDEVVQSLAFGPLLEGLSLAWTDAGWGIDLAPTPGTATKTATRGAAVAKGACRPSLAAVPAQPQEGELVALTVQCASKAVVEGRGTTFLGDPTLLTVGDGTATWTPALDTAGRHAFLAATWTADPEVPPETAVLDVDVADAWNDPKNVLVDPVTYQEEWGIPVIHLATTEPLGSGYKPATATFQGHAYTMEAKYRGASSYSYPEKSFTLRFDEKDSIDLGDWDMGHRDHLVLVTTFDDNSLLRQKLVYDLWAALAEDAGADDRLVPRSFFVVLYLDGSYFGLYLAIDHVDDELTRDMGFVGDGNMYKAVDHNGNFYRESVYGGMKSTLHDGYEKKEGLPSNDFSDLDALVAFSADSDDDTFRAEAPDWIRVSDFVDWYFLVLYTSAYDSGGKNSYLYDDDPAGDIEFRFAPWDMNESFGQDWMTLRLDASANPSYWKAVNGIFDHLLTHPDSAAEIAARAEHLLNDGPLALTSVDGRVDDLTDELGAHLDRSWDKWGYAYRNYGSWSWRDDFTTPTEEVAYIHDWLGLHDVAMRQLWGL